MKNLKKVLALVVACVMLFTMSSFAFTDVEADASYLEAATLLNKLGIITGYEDGSFLPNNTITRAEAATVLVRALNGTEEAKGMAASNMFTDVPASHWAAGYVNYAATYGIVNGRGAGIFDPEAPVAYEEIVKMIVAMLGWTPAAEEKGGYPTGYLYAANKLIKGADKIALTKGASGSAGQPAARWIVAKLLFNALEANFMDKDSFGSKDAEYKAIDMNLLEDYLEVTKVEGILDVDFLVSFDDKENLEVTITGEEAVTLDKATEDVAQYQGYYVTAYANEDDELIGLAPKAGENNVLVLGYDVLAELEENEPDHEITYEINDKEYTIELAEAIYDSVVALYETEDDGTVTLIDNNDDKVYDVALIETIGDEFVVDEINKKNYKLTEEDGTSYRLNPEADDAFVMFIKNGAVVDFDAIAEGDVVSTSVTGTVTKAYISDAKVEGTVTSTADGVKINGTTYVDKTESIARGDKGVFFLNYAGKIVATEAEESSVNGNYAFLLYPYADKVGREFVYGLGFVNAAGEKVEANFASKVNVAIADAEVVVVKETADTTFIEALLAALDVLVEGEEDAFDFAADAPRFVKIDLNSDGEIKAIALAGEAADDEDYFNGGAFDAAYDEDAEEFVGGYAADKNTVIFQLNGVEAVEDVTKASQVTVVTGKTFKDGETYEGFAYDAEDFVYGAMILTTETNTIADEAPLFVVESVEIAGEEDEEYLVINGFVNGEEATLETVAFDDATVTGAVLADIDAAEAFFAKGTIIEYAVDAAEKVTDIDVIYAEELIATNEGDTEFITGYVYKVDAKKTNKNVYLLDVLTFETTDEDEADATFYSAGKKMVGNIYEVKVAEKASKTKIEVASAVEASDWYETEGEEATLRFAVVKVYDGEVIDVVIFTTEVEEFSTTEA